jgi:hypothetical protein
MVCFNEEQTCFGFAFGPFHFAAEESGAEVCFAAFQYLVY